MKAIFGLCVAACAAWAAPAWSAQTLRYVVLVDGGKQAGQQNVSVGDDGITRVDYVFKDNGRGPAALGIEPFAAPARIATVED